MKRRRALAILCVSVILLTLGRVTFLLASSWVVLETEVVHVRDNERNGLGVPFSITVTNRSLRTLVISKISTSCSCVKVQLTNSTLPPFQKTQLTGNVSLGERLGGEGQFFVYLATNSVFQRPRRIVIDWERSFVGGVVASPENIIVSGGKGALFSRTVDLFVSAKADSLSVGVNAEGIVGHLLGSDHPGGGEVRHFILEITGSLPLGSDQTSGTLLVKAVSQGRNVGETVVEVLIKP